MFISIDDVGRIERVLRNRPHSDAPVIIVTDGERILCLGDAGVDGMRIPEGNMYEPEYPDYA